MYPAVPWMPPVAPFSGCPPGLEYLTTLDNVHVHQTVDLMETLIPFEHKNKYKIMNSRREQCYFGVEESGIFERQMCNARRPFRMVIIDNFGRVVFYVERPLSFCSDEVTVHLYDGSLLGKIYNPCSFSYCGITCDFEITDQMGQKIFDMREPCCYCSCCGSAQFDVYPAGSSNRIGQVRKEFSGFFQEYFTDADIFTVDFPIDLDVRMKAVLLGAVFLLDFMFFESEPGHSGGGGGMNVMF